MDHIFLINTRTMRALTALLSLLIVTWGCKQTKTPENATPEVAAPKPTNVILLIGDGTGLSQVSAAQFYKDGPVNYDRFPVIGLIKTSSSSDLVTDSAAGATAFASGIKTYNGAVGVNVDTLAVNTIAEEAAQRGLATGIVATSSITHATPACFYAHVPLRRAQEDIALQLVQSPIEYFAGAGTDYFAAREDGQNLLVELEKQGFYVDTTGLNPAGDSPKAGYLLAGSAMPKSIDGRGDFLPDATKMGIERLSNNSHGFFLMVEGSQIDWGGHDNDGDYLIGELIDFDQAIGVALDFAEKDGNTLVIVTADHETGGFTLASRDGDYGYIEPTFSTGGHSATMVPVFAFGPGAEYFGGIYENTQIYHKMKALLLP